MIYKSLEEKAMSLSGFFFAREISGVKTNALSAFSKNCEAGSCDDIIFPGTFHRKENDWLFRKTILDGGERNIPT